MSIKVMSEVWADGPDDCTELLVLLALADHADDHGRCWPCIATIAQKTRKGTRAVQRAIRRLEDNGWLTVSFQAAKKGANFYIIHSPVKTTPLSKRAS